MDAIAFYIRNEEGNLVFAKARRVGETNNVKVNALAIMKALTYCQSQNIEGMTVETNSLILQKMI